MKRTLYVLLSMILLLAFGLPLHMVNAYSEPILNQPIKLTCHAFDNRVLNVYTSGDPELTNPVTLYSSSNGTSNHTQTWKFMTVPEYSSSALYAYKLVLYYDQSLAAQYNHTTQKCTVYPWASDPYSDYVVGKSSENSNNEFNIRLYFTGRILGNSGNWNGAQCYWYSLGSTDTIPSSYYWAYAY